LLQAFLLALLPIRLPTYPLLYSFSLSLFHISSVHLTADPYLSTITLLHNFCSAHHLISKQIQLDRLHTTTSPSPIMTEKKSILSPREMETLALTWQCFTTEPKVHSPRRPASPHTNNYRWIPTSWRLSQAVSALPPISHPTASTPFKPPTSPSPSHTITVQHRPARPLSLSLTHRST
jgi:hypothetical protein